VWQAGDTQLIPKSHKSSGGSVSGLPRRWLIVNYPVVGNWDLVKGFGIKALPVTLPIDRDGKVADFHDQGLIDRQTFEIERSSRSSPVGWSEPDSVRKSVHAGGR